MFIGLNLVGCLLYSYCKITSKVEKSKAETKAKLHSFPSDEVLRSFPSSAGILYDKRYSA